MKNEFKKERIAVYEKVPKTVISDIIFKTNDVGDDFIEDTLTYMMYGNIYSKMADERILYYYTPKPTFFDWLLGRRKMVEFKLRVKDILISPPQKETIRIYETEQL
jgi:hypothetical protein